MKRPLIYLLLIVVLGAIAFYLLKQNRSSTISGGENEFAYNDTRDVNKIILTSQDEEQAVLSKEDGVWMVNGKFEARRRAVKTLLNTIRRIQPLYPVSKAGHDDVVRELMSSAIKVEVFASGKRDPVKTIHVGGGAINNDGTYMILEQNNRMAKRPYIVNIPGFSGYLTSRFITDEEEWRSTEVIRYNSEDIQSVSVEYPSEPYASFSIVRTEEGELELRPPTDATVIAERMKAYLDLFDSKSIEAYENSYSKIDSIKMNDPFCVLTIQAEDVKPEQFKVYYKPVSDRTKFKFDANNVPMQYDVDRYFVSFNDGKDFGILQYYVFGPLFRNRSEFIQSNR